MGGCSCALLACCSGCSPSPSSRTCRCTRAMLEVSELIYETCKTYLIDAGQVHPGARGVHRRDHGVLLRLAGPVRIEPFRVVDHPCVFAHRHCRQLRRRVVRYSRQHVRELPRRVREPAWQAVSHLRDSAARGHEHRHAAHQRRTAADADDSAVHSRQPGGRLLHRIRHRRVARRGGAAGSRAASSRRSPTSGRTS